MNNPKGTKPTRKSKEPLRILADGPEELNSRTQKGHSHPNDLIIHKGKVTARDDGKGLRQMTNEAARVTQFQSLGAGEAKKAPLRTNAVAH